ncbi:MAG: hypothetical protein IKN77_09020 [Paludibacteraceae bacterium]|nr:hypothetical protein [Paludibacteraceae bacterium]
MRKILLIIATLFTVMCANASNVEKIQFANAGKFSLGVMAGFPFFEEGINNGMPYVSLDAMMGLTDGFCHTNKFGDNGAIDLGVYVGYARNEYNFRELVYNEESRTTEDLGEYTWSSWAIPATFRGAFHWEFVKNLDVYAGLQLGCSTYGTKKTPHVGGKESETLRIDLIACHYLGVKWMFTKFFGVKAECNMLSFPVSDRYPKLPMASVGFQFNF